MSVPRGQPGARARRRVVAAIAVLLAVGAFALLGAPPGTVSFSQSTQRLDTYDFIELTAGVAPPRARNPFTDAAIRATFENARAGRRWQIDGFSDAEDGSLYRVRFMPSLPGDYTFTVEYRQGWSTRRWTGTFQAAGHGRRGPIRIDPDHRWHFIWEGTGEHYFFNGTTAYWLVGWADDRVIESSLERLHALKVNRVRVTLAGRTGNFFGEPVMPGRAWTSFITPWQMGGTPRVLHLLGRLGQRSGLSPGRHVFDLLANVGRPEDIYHPGFVYSRFDVAYWRKFERMLRAARDRDVIISVVLDMNDSQVHPPPDSEDERRFIRYAIARFGAFSNITWDLGDDLDGYRDDAWTRRTGTLVKAWDPNRHLATSHPLSLDNPDDNEHQDRASDWFDFTSVQDWSRTQHSYMLAQRRKQLAAGRIIPQTNEEYGYEDHYPLWSKGPGSDSADTLRRMAWEIVMAGGYQTSGETARRGTNVWPDTGGGWLNGRGDDTMTMFEGYAHMVDFFTSFEWWKAEPHDELVSGGNYCLAQPGALYAVYLPHGGPVTVTIPNGTYRAVWWNAATGGTTALPAVNVTGSSWRSPAPPAPANGAATRVDDWALLIRKN